MQFNRVDTDKGYAGAPNRKFLAAKEIADGIMRKDSTTAKFTQLNTFEERLLRNLTGRAELEIERNTKISKVRYIACPVRKLPNICLKTCEPPVLF
jgi:IS5 family transposase